MGGLVKGDVVVVPFPFSDLSASKKRPALVAATLTGNDVILCQITSKAKSDSYAISITTNDCASGNLNQPSNVRPNRLFTADSQIVIKKVATLNPVKMQEITDRLVQILTA